MVDLSVEFAGLKFKNPLVAASGAIGSPPATIRRCIESGAGAVTIKSVGLDKENQLLPRPGNFFLDIETARPPLTVPFGYGRWLRGLANYATYLSANKTGLQVMSSGGIWTWRDAVERMMCGASLASLESPVQYHGYRIFGDMLKGMTDFMERKGYRQSHDMIGAAMPHIYNVKELLTWYNGATVPAETLRTLVDKEKCNGCKKCASCIYEAIVMENALPRIDNEACQKCGVCVSICPTDAMTIVPA